MAKLAVVGISFYYAHTRQKMQYADQRISIQNRTAPNTANTIDVDQALVSAAGITGLTVKACSTPHAHTPHPLPPLQA